MVWEVVGFFCCYCLFEGVLFGCFLFAVVGWLVIWGFFLVKANKVRIHLLPPEKYLH